MPVLASDSASASCWQRWIAPKPAAMDRYVQPISLAGFPPPVDLQPSVSCRLRCDDTSDDTLIAATGYLIDLPFLSPEVVPIRDNAVDLYQRIVPPGWPGLYFMGMFNTDTALNMVFEHQARWIREIELGNAVLPNEAEMRAAIADHKDWVQRHYRDSPRHTIEEEHVPYLGSLKRTLREAQRRRR